MPYTVIRALWPVTVNFYDSIIRYLVLLVPRACKEWYLSCKVSDKNLIFTLFKALILFTIVNLLYVQYTYVNKYIHIFPSFVSLLATSNTYILLSTLLNVL